MSVTGDSSFDSRPLSEVVAANVRRLRAGMGLSEDDLAGSAQCTPEFIAAVEKGEAPETGVDELANIARALGVDAADLVHRDSAR